MAKPIPAVEPVARAFFPSNWRFTGLVSLKPLHETFFQFSLSHRRPEVKYLALDGSKFFLYHFGYLSPLNCGWLLELCALFATRN
jgi:hypothetical protein